MKYVYADLASEEREGLGDIGMQFVEDNISKKILIKLREKYKYGHLSLTVGSKQSFKCRLNNFILLSLGEMHTFGVKMVT